MGADPDTLGAGVPQASAATSTTACFQWGANTLAPGSPYTNRSVQLWQTTSDGTLIAKLRDGRTGSNGCATFYNTPTNVSLRMRAVHVDTYFGGSDLYVGLTPRVGPPGAGGFQLGLGYVNFIG